MYNKPNILIFIYLEQSMLRKFTGMFFPLEAQTGQGYSKVSTRESCLTAHHSHQRCHAGQFSMISNSNGNYHSSFPNHVNLALASSQHPVSLCDYICDSQVSGTAKNHQFWTSLPFWYGMSHVPNHFYFPILHSSLAV